MTESQDQAREAHSPRPLWIDRAREAANRIGRAASELEEVFHRISTTYSQPLNGNQRSSVSVAIAQALHELRLYSQASQLLIPSDGRSEERQQLIEQLDRSRPIVNGLRRCDAWYDDEIVESKDGQRALDLSSRIHSDSLDLGYWMRDLDALDIDLDKTHAVDAWTPLLARPVVRGRSGFHIFVTPPPSGGECGSSR
jgi:hypothetical protein